MKATAISRYGSPDDMERLDLPVAWPASEEIRIQVFAPAVDRTDTAF